MSTSEIGYWNRMAGLYDSFMRRNRKAYAAVMRRLATVISPDDTLLELAAGTGVFTAALAAHARTVVATDFAPQMLRIAQTKVQADNVSFAVADACHLPYADGSFDVVFVANALHIMPDPAQAMREIRRVLKPNGRLIAPTFVRTGSLGDRLWSRILVLFTGFPDHQKWTAAQFQQFITSHAFTITEEAIIKSSGFYDMDYLVARSKNFE